MRIALPRFLLDAALQKLHVGHEEIVADQLHAFAEGGRQLLPARPIVLGQPVFDRNDRIAIAQFGIKRDHPVGVDRAVARERKVLSVLIELA